MLKKIIPVFALATLCYTGSAIADPALTDGNLELKVRSYAPTSNAYYDIPEYNVSSPQDYHLRFTGVRIRVTPIDSDPDLQDVGAYDETINLSTPRDFYFKPALTATPKILNFTGSGYEAQSDAHKNITINAAKRFSIDLENLSSNSETEDINIGLTMTTDESDVTWGESGIDNIHGMSARNLSLDTSGEFDDVSQNWNDIGKDLATGFNQKVQLFAKPILDSGASTPSSFGSYFQAFLNYIVDGRNPVYPAATIDLGGDTQEVRNTNIQIIGTAHSDIDFSTNLENLESSKNVGDIFKEESKSAVSRNVARFVNDENIIDKFACKELDITITANNWDDLEECLYEDGSVLFLRDSSITIEELPEGNNTVAVYGGNILIADDLIPTYADDTFGIIALKDMSEATASNPLGGGGNVFISPNVSNVSALLYADGSVMSVNENVKPLEDNNSGCDGSRGFCDRSTELHNQLYWQGSLISNNTIGGSDRSTYICPSQFSTICVSRDVARLFDFNYLRTFHADSGGNRAENPAPPGGNTNNHAFIIEYSNRLKTNPPPLFGQVSGGGGSSLGY